MNTQKQNMTENKKEIEIEKSMERDYNLLHDGTCECVKCMDKENKKEIEFNLSEKGQQLEGLEMPFYNQEDVKEFIKRLKEEIIKINKTAVGYDKNNKYLCALDMIDLKEIIDKLAGDKLK